MFLNIDLHEKERVAAIDDGNRIITYGELCGLRSKMKDVIQPGSVIFLLCENVIGALASYICCLENGVVPLLLNVSADRELLSELVDRYQPTHIWLPERKTNEYPDCETVALQYGYGLLKTRHERYAVNPELALLMTTSGSTGSPKLVKYKKSNLEANAKNVALAFGWTKEERPICDLQMNYTMGLNVINTHLYVGATLLLTTHNLMSADFWRYIKEQKATNFTGVPFSYEILMRLRFTRMDLPYLTTFAEGGGKLTDKLFAELAEYARRTGKRFFATFGTTETSARMAYLPPEKAIEKIGSIGVAIPEGELFLVDEDGRTIETAEADGELCYRGPNVTMGYATRREELLTADAFCGEYRTGDAARRDADGYYYVIGRKSRFLKLTGHRVSLDQCERMIKARFDVQCACTGKDDRMLIYLEPSADAEAVIRFISEKTGIYRSAFKHRFIDALPMSDSGKIAYKRLPPE